MEWWTESLQAEPLALGFGGTRGNISGRIQRLATKINLYPKTFQDFRDISKKRQKGIERFETYAQTLEECADFLYDYNSVKTGAAFSTRMSGSPELPWKIPRYVYSNDDIARFEERIDLQLAIMRATMDDLVL